MSIKTLHAGFDVLHVQWLAIRRILITKTLVGKAEKPGREGMASLLKRRGTDQRNRARRDYSWAKSLQAQLDAYEWNGKHWRGAAEHTGKGKGKKVVARAWHEFSYEEQWWLMELDSGRLKEKKRRTEAMCSKAQAKHFSLEDEEVMS